MTRRRAVLLTLGLLLLLDVARSIHARTEYATPVQEWQPDPTRYVDLTWPPGADLVPNTPLGARVYAQRCAVCHGPDGRGNGPAAPSLIPHPRDFTQGIFKYRSTTASHPPTDDDLIQTISHGLAASAMPYWNDLLSPEEIRAVVDHVKGFSPVFSQPAPTPLVIPARPAPDAESILRGKALFETVGCVACHGHDARGGRRLRDANGHEIVSRDLTAPWTFRGGSNPQQLWLRLTTGLAPSPMPSFADQTTEEQRWHLVNYVLSLARVPPWETGGRLDGPGQSTDPVQRGAYLVHAEMCGLCHTQINRTGIYRGDDFYLAGGMRVDVGAHGHLVSRNLTGDEATGLGLWTKKQIMVALRDGRAPDRILNPLDMPWLYFHTWPDDDAEAIAQFLKTQPPVRNFIPPALRFGVLETIGRKLLRPWPAFPPKVLVFVDGNFGEPGDHPKRGRAQTYLINAQWVVLMVGVLAFFMMGTRPEHPFARSASLIRTTVWFLGLLLVLFLGWAIYRLPAMSWIPPEQIAAQALDRIPQPDQSTIDSPERAAMIARGRLLYTVGSCALCHHPEGDGGLKISWKAFGTLWTRNITPDRETGIGTWSDQEIARAIRSGVTPDGRMLHWQGMIWDHASNWDEEDLRSIIAYIRTLPPVTKQIAPARPPAEDDCDRYTFWISESDTPGCL